MKIKMIEIYERSRFWNPDESEKFVLRLKLYGSQEEMEKVRARIFNLEKEEK